MGLKINIRPSSNGLVQSEHSCSFCLIVAHFIIQCSCSFIQLQALNCDLSLVEVHPLLSTGSLCSQILEKSKISSELVIAVARGLGHVRDLEQVCRVCHEREVFFEHSEEFRLTRCGGA